jgi:hypothetical protein
MHRRTFLSDFKPMKCLPLNKEKNNSKKGDFSFVQMSVL